jgi:uncharacterized membrane protein
MTKVNKQGSRRPETKRKAGSPKPVEAQKTTTGAAGKDMMVTPKDSTSANKAKQSAKSNQARVGGTAVQGAKSTQPKEITTTNPQQQQAESYNRDMRRRMQHLGTGPTQGSTVQDQRQKRLEKRKKRVEERRQEVKKVAATGPRNISLGRRNTYFLIAVVVVIILVIIVAYLINHH